MEIKDLKIRQGNVDIVVDVADVSEPREFTKFGTVGKVATATVRDATGECKMTLWNEDVEKVKKGTKVHIINGYVNEYQGEMQLTSGRFGKIEIAGEADTAEAAETTDEKTEEEALEGEKTDKGEKVVTEDEKTEEESLDIEEEKVE